MRPCLLVSAALAACVTSIGPPPSAAPTGQSWSSDLDLRTRSHVGALVAFGPRQAGTMNEGRTARYVADQFEAMGLPTAIEELDFQSFEVSWAELRIEGQPFVPVGLGVDPYQRPVAHAGEFIVLDPGSPTGWPAPPAVAGQAVVTVETADPSLHFRIARLQPQAIVYLQQKDFEPVQGLKSRHGVLTVQGGHVRGVSRNVIAHLGARPPSPQIILGAHLDAYRDSPGANDNASGVAALLELARRFRGLPAPEGVGLTFVAFGAEELGIVGSRSFVDRHVDDIKHCELALALDDLGGDRPVHIERNGGRSVLPPGRGVARVAAAYQGRSWEGVQYPWKLLPSPALFEAIGTGCHPDWLVESIDAAVRELDFEVRFTEIQGSDQMAFAQAGVATTGISAVNGLGHSQRDRPETVNVERVVQCTRAAERLVHHALLHLGRTSCRREACPGAPSGPTRHPSALTCWE